MYSAQRNRRLETKALNYLKENGRPPRSAHPDEAPLYRVFKNRLESDPLYAAAARLAGWVPRSERNQRTEDGIISFIETHGRRPSASSRNQEERRLAQGLGSRIVKSNTLYSPAFVKRFKAAMKKIEN